MAYDRPHIRLSWLFRIIGQREVAVTSVNLAPAAPSTTPYDSGQLPSEAGLQALGTAMATFLQGGGIRWAAYSQLYAVKAAVIGNDGGYSDEPRSVELTTAVRGTSQEVPPQCTVAVTLWSGERLGTTNYGRMYLPHSTFNLGGNPYGGTDDQTTVANNAATFLGALQVGTNRPAIMGTNGRTRFVDYVRVGRVVDTQRRRRESLDELPLTVEL